MLNGLLVDPGGPANLSERKTDDHLGLDKKPAGQRQLAELIEELSLLHNRLYAEATRSLLLILQGLDASGKDGTIRSVLTGVNPQGCRIVSFKEPSANELAHDYLWRVHLACPERGEIAIFNRSHYEDVVAARVRGLVPKSVWKRRPRQIREFERLLVDEGTAVVKVFLHVSRDEQGKRLHERLVDPEKAWKFRQSDLDDRAHWDEYIRVYDEVLGETSTRWAPWYVVPGDHNWVRNVAVARILVETLKRIDPRLPSPPALPSELVIH